MHSTKKAAWIIAIFLLWTFTTYSQGQQSPFDSTASQKPVDQTPGSITGTIVDPDGAAVVGAQLKLSRASQSAMQELKSGDDGQFTFSSVAPGLFDLTITAQGFALKVFSGTLHPGEVLVVPQIPLALASETTVVRVTPSQVEVAETQIKEEEKQRVLGVIPNFYVSYVPDAAPLDTRQKFQLAWKSTIDPFNFGFTAAIAGVEQAHNYFSGYGQGSQGYAKRYGATFTDGVTATFIGGAILPSLLKQDPRYFYKGTGTIHGRALYAIANAVICKGDNRRWQPNYSGIMGSIASGGISNLYYPRSNRSGAALTFINAGVGLGATAAANLFQEFIVKKITPKLPNHDHDPINP